MLAVPCRSPRDLGLCAATISRVALGVVLSMLAACGRSDETVSCRTGADCLQGSIPGECLPSPKSDTSWCAFPDTSCPSGQRWGILSGDGLDATCVELADAGVPHDDAGPDAPVDAAPMVDGSMGSGPDAAPPNCNIIPACSAPIDLGAITADDHAFPPPSPYRVTYESNGDPAWYRVRLVDTPAAGNLTAQVRLQMSAGTNYDLRVFCVSCGGQLAAIGDQANLLEVADVRRNNTEADDSFDILIEVKPYPNSTGCGPYLLEVEGNQPLGVVTCN